MKNILRKIFFGDIQITEYSTITIKNGVKERVYLEAGHMLEDITSRHWLLCLNPIVFGIWVEKKEESDALQKSQDYTIYFKEENNDSREQKTLARIRLDYFDRIEESNGTLFLFELKTSRIFHLGRFKTYLMYYKYYRKPGLSFNRLKSFVSSYSYPRKVRVISFKKDEYYNIFPMDLVGMIPGTTRCVFGLRHTNVTLSKIIETGKLVASEFSFDHKEVIYQLGRHHGSSPPPIESLPFKVRSTDHFQFYVPEWVDTYREINIYRTMNLGSHMLLWGEWENERQLKECGKNLYHIHFLLYFYQVTKGDAYTLV
ncbi:MAG: hypothetical protein C5B59_17135 [Bacteroidetes bacterium]|nr:MAG: hypothetical protein C5B59_17135 [Bacteroidota bacterium]